MSVGIVYLQFSLGVGAIILILLNLVEFRRRFRPYLKTSHPRTLALFSVFSIINLAIYFLLCMFFLQSDPIALFQLDSPIESKTTILSVFQPVLVAVMYFGTGALTVKVGGIEFQFYDKILGYIESLLPERVEQPDPDTVEKALAQYQEYKTLCSQIDSLRNMAEVDERWDLLDDEWNQTGITTLSNELDYLANLLSRLDSNENRENLIKSLQLEFNSALGTLRENAERYVFKFIARNGKTFEDVERIYKQGLKYPPPPRQATVRPSPRIERALVLSFAFGLLFGPIYALSQQEPVSIVYALVGASALAVFGTILSLTVQKAGRKIFLYLFGGATSGIAAQVVWNFARWWLIDKPIDEPHHLVFGLAIGLVTAAYLYVFRFYLRRYFESSGKPDWYIYFAVAIAGATTLPLTVLLLQLPDLPTVKQIAQEASIGAITAIGVSFGTNIFAKEKVSVDQDG